MYWKLKGKSYKGLYIKKFLEKLEGFICWKIAIAASCGDTKWFPYKSKGDENALKRDLTMSDWWFFNREYYQSL